MVFWLNDEVPAYQSRSKARYSPQQYGYNVNHPSGNYRNPYAGHQTQQRRSYGYEDDTHVLQMKQQRAERLRQQREQHALAAEAQRQQAEAQRREVLRERRLFLIKAKIATRTIQRAWRAHHQRRLAEFATLENEASCVVTRAMKNFGPIINAKRVLASLRQLKSIEDQVEAVDPATAVTGKGITLFEHIIDKLIAQLDLIDSWGNVGVRARRKQVVIRADERVRQILAKEEAKSQQETNMETNMDVEEDEDVDPSSETESAEGLDSSSTDTEDVEMVDEFMEVPSFPLVVEQQQSQQHTPPPVAPKPKTYATAIKEDKLAQLLQKFSFLTEQLTRELKSTETQINVLKSETQTGPHVMESLREKIDRMEAALKLLRA